jgi:Polysaccharide lyase
MLVPTAASAHVVWKGDFETGNTSQWTKEEMVNSNRLTVVTDRVREGSYALRCEVDQGDNPIQASGNRNELVYVGEEYEPEVAQGSEYYYSWSTLFDESFPSANTWQLFTQWHHTGLTGSPPVEFYVFGEELRMRVGGELASDVWSAPLQRGVWNDFILHVKWSADPNVGFVELYHDGQVVVPRKSMATMYAGQGVYLKQGLYRNDTVAPQGVVFHDGFTVATELADVLPARAPSPVSAAAPADETMPATVMAY